MDRTLSLMVKFAALDKLTAPLRAMGGGARKTSADLAATRREVLSLERAAGKVGGYRDLTAKIADSEAAMDQAKDRVTALKAAIAAADGPTGRLARSLEAAERKVDRLGHTTGEQNARLEKLGAELREAGVDVADLAGSEEKLAASLARVNDRLAEQRRAADRAAASQARRQKVAAFGDRAGAAGGSMMIGAATTAAPVAVAVKAAISYEAAFAGVKKVVSGTNAEIAQLDRGILSLSRRVPIEPAGIAAIVAAGAQSGVAREELLRFAADASKMGVAFDMAAEDAGTTMAAWRKAFALDQDGVIQLADKINYLGNTAGAKADVIAAITTRIGPLGGVAGLASGEIAALGATLASMGIEEEVAATGIKNTMLALTKGTAATKSQKAAFEDLGLKSTKVAKAMQRDAAGTIMDVMRRISRLPKASQAGLMTELFGSESIAAIAPLMSQLDTLRVNFGRVGDTTKYAGSMTAEFAGQNATTEAKLKAMGNSIERTKIMLGARFLPLVERGAARVADFADRVAYWTDRNPMAAKTLMMVASGLAMVLGILGATAIAVSLFVKPLVWLWPYLDKMGAGISKLGSVLRLFGGVIGWIARGFWIAAAAIAGFVGLPVWLVAAIGIAIGAAGVLIYRNWDRIRATFGGGLAYLRGLWGSFREAGANIVRGLASGIGAMFGAVRAKIMALGRSAIGWFKGVLGIHSPSRVFAELGGHMMGGLALGLDRGVDGPLARVRAAGVGLTRAMAISTVAATPALASAPAGAGAASIGEVHIHLAQSPGEDSGAFAKRVAEEVRKLQRGDQVARASSYRDEDD